MRMRDIADDSIVVPDLDGLPLLRGSSRVCASG